MGRDREGAARVGRADRAFWTSTALSLAAFAVLGPLERRVGMIGEDDLSRIWAGPRALLAGSDPYDAATWYATAVGLGTQPPDTAVYIYPPWVTLVLLPLAALPLAAASAVWLAAGLAASILMLRRALRALLPGRAVEHAVFPVVLILSWSAVVNLVIGQWGHLLVAALFATVLALRDGRVITAGLTAVAMIIKPQLFLFTAPALAVRALWPAAGRGPEPGGVRFIGVALALTAVLIAVAWVALPQWWPSWLEGVAGRQIQATRNTVSGFLGTVAGPIAASLAPLVILALAAVAARFHPRSPGWLPVWLSLSLVAVPYASSYDHVLLIVPVVLAAGALLPVSAGASRSAMVACAGVMLVGTPVMYGVAVLRHSESLSVVIPLAVFAIVTRALWPLRSVPPTVAAT